VGITNNVPGERFVPRQQEQRLSERTKIERITYVELPSGNGGIVRDVSEGGLGFCAVAPLDSPTSVPVTIRVATPGGLKRVRASGDLAWTDETRKCGGLRFTQLPDESLAEIRRWQFESNGRAQTSKHRDEQPQISQPRVSPPMAPADAVPPQSEPPERSKREPRQPLQLPHPVVAAATATPPAHRHLGLLMVTCVSILAGTIGFMSNGWYREVRARFAARGEDSQGQTSHVLAQVLASSRTPVVAFAEAGDVAGQNGSFETAPTPAPVPPSITPAVAGPMAGSLTDVRANPLPNRPPARPTLAGPANQFFFVEAGVYTQQAEAQKFVEKLRQQNFFAYASGPGDDARYRVQLGPFTTEEAAELAQGALGQAGFYAFVREPQDAR
jgi:cell division septation protein DedD